MAVPQVKLDSIENISNIQAIAVGSYASDGGKAITERGFVVATHRQPTTSDTKYSYSDTLGQNVSQSPYVNESMASAPSVGVLKNSANWNAGGYLELTWNAGSLQGQWELFKGLPLSLEVDFEFFTGGGSGADAVFFYLNDNSTPINEDAANNGYSFNYDEWTDQVQIEYNGNFLATVAQANIDNSTWHQGKIIVDGTRLKMYFDKVLVLDITDSARTLRDVSTGFGARTGGSNNYHWIRNVKISPLEYTFQKTLTGLSPGTTYYVRAFATNADGTTYGQEMVFTTKAIKKQYIYRVYNGGTYVDTWTKDVLSEPRFRNTINGGPGELVIKLGRKFDDFGEDVDVKLANIVECWCVDKDTPNGTLLYRGYISGYRPIIDEASESVEVTVLGFVAELQRILLRDSSGNTTLTYNSYDPSNILKDIIDKYRALGGHLNYSATSVPLTNTVVSYTFNTNTVKEALDKVIELCPTGWYYRIDADGTVNLQPKNDLADHAFTLGLDVEKLDTFRRIEDIVNRVFFTGAGNPSLYLKYENTGSVDSYGPYEDRIVDQRVSSSSTATIMASRQINSKKDPEIRSTFVILDNNGPRGRGYNIESVKVGQTLQVRNLKTSTKTITYWDIGLWDTDVWDQTLATSAADVLQIQSIQYTPDSILIEASSRLPQIAKRIEDIERNLENTQTVNNPIAPS